MILCSVIGLFVCLCFCADFDRASRQNALAWLPTWYRTFLRSTKPFIIKIITIVVLRKWFALRVRTFLHQTFQVFYVYCNFILGNLCRMLVNFGTLKDWSLSINILALNNNCCSDKNIFDALSKKMTPFWPKPNISPCSYHLIMFKFC